MGKWVKLLLEVCTAFPFGCVQFPELGGRGDQRGFKDSAHALSEAFQSGVPCTKPALLLGNAR